MRLTFRTIPHGKQRYNTVGDWYYKGAWWMFRVSKMKPKIYMFLVFIHELVEWWWCLENRVFWGNLDSFDMKYEDAREKGIAAPCGCVPTETSEPGHDIHAPYHEGHVIAEKVERFVAELFMVEWKEYEKTVDSL